MRRVGRDIRRAGRSSLVGARDLDQVAAGVVEHGCRDRAHCDGLLGESHSESTKSLELQVDVVDGERSEGDAVLDERLLEWLRGGVSVRLEQKLGSPDLLGETTVSQRASPREISVFFTNPSTSV